MNMSFLTYCALNQLPDWGEILSLPVDERMVKLADPETRILMENRAAAPEAGVFARLTGWGRYRIGDTFSAANEGLKGRLVADIARERGVRDFFALLDIVLADDLRTVLWPGPDRRRRRELAHAGRRLALGLRHARRLRRRRPPRPHVRRARTRPSSSATACGASSSSGSRRPCTT